MIECKRLLCTNKTLPALFISLIVLSAAEAQVQDEFQMQKLKITETNPSVTFESLLVDKQEALGTIVGSYKNQKYLSNGDTIYLHLKNPSVSPGDEFVIYDDLGPVSDPKLAFSKVGSQILIKGFATVTQVTPQAILAKIYDANTEVHLGDLVGPALETSVDLKPTEPSTMITGEVLSSAADAFMIGSYEFAFINRGSAEGLKVNDLLYVYRTSDGNPDIDPDLPQVNIAELVVVNAAPHFATVYCLDSDETFAAGAAFKSARSEVKYLDKAPDPIP
jgi:hypothetical protein